MSVAGWVLLVGVVWFTAGAVLALALGRVLAPPWWERMAEDIDALPEQDDPWADCPICSRWTEPYE